MARKKVLITLNLELIDKLGDLAQQRAKKAGLLKLDASAIVREALRAYFNKTED